MSLATTILGIIAAWMMVASAMLWGVLRIARRRHFQDQNSVTEEVKRSEGLAQALGSGSK